MGIILETIGGLGSIVIEDETLTGGTDDRLLDVLQ